MDVVSVNIKKTITLLAIGLEIHMFFLQSEFKRESKKYFLSRPYNALIT